MMLQRSFLYALGNFTAASGDFSHINSKATFPTKNRRRINNGSI